MVFRIGSIINLISISIRTDIHICIIISMNYNVTFRRQSPPPPSDAGGHALGVCRGCAWLVQGFVLGCAHVHATVVHTQ